MKRVLPAIIVIISLLFLTGTVVASADDAHKQYTALYDTYRQAYNDFKIAKNEYDKYQTLTARTTAIDKTKKLLDARDTLLKAYLQFLNEKISENKGMTASDKSLYQGMIANEITFLDGQLSLIPSIGSTDDATTVSEQLESHYNVLQTSIHQTIAGLALGDLTYFAAQYDAQQAKAEALVNQNRQLLSPDTVAVANRWLLSISNKRTLCQQKIDQVTRTNASLKTSGSDQLIVQTSAMLKTLGEAKTDLQDGSSYMNELLQALQYQN